MADRMWDPEPLSSAQLAGRACIVCRQRWPAPVADAGRLPSGNRVRACRTCAAALEPEEPADDSPDHFRWFARRSR